MSPKARSFVLLLAVLLVHGCSTYTAYPGPEKPRGRIALIETMNAFDHLVAGGIWPRLLGPTVSLNFLSIDGKKMSGGHYIYVVELGRHILSVRLLSCSGNPFVSTVRCKPSAKTDISFEAEAGKTYLARGEFKDGEPAYWIEEKVTKRVVAGRKQESQ